MKDSDRKPGSRNSLQKNLKEMTHMATKNNVTTKLILKVAGEKDADGKEQVLQRTFNRVNPAISDNDFYHVATQIAALQTRDVLNIARTDNATISE